MKSTVKNVGLFKRILLSSLCCLFYVLVPQLLCSEDLGTLASKAYLLRILNNWRSFHSDTNNALHNYTV